MKLVKKIIKKIYHLIWFLSLLLFLLPINAHAQTYNLSFNSFADTAEDLSSNIQCNNNQCIVYNVPFYNYRMDFEWGTTSSPTCTSTAVVSGILYLDNTSFGINNNDFNWSRVYIVPTGTGQKLNCSFSVSENGTSYVCTAPNLSSNFRIGYTLDNNFGGQMSFTSVIVRNVDINCDTSTGQIIENNNNNTQNIINNNNNNTQDIINNNNNNTQDIINNQNDNTQQQIDSQKVCKNIDKSSAPNKSFLNANGQLSNSNSSVTTNFFSINSSTTLKVLQVASSGTYRTCFYDINKNFISCLTNSDLVVGSNVIFPTGSAYFRSTISVSENKPTFEYCQSGNQALNDSVNDLNDSITNDDAPDIDLSLNESSDTPISDLLTMPLTILNTLITNLSDTCSNYTIPFFFSTTVTFPCFTLSDYLGTTVTNYIDLFICLYMCYNIAMLCVSVFDDITSLNDIFNSLYTPRHAYTGYKPKHGGD